MNESDKMASEPTVESKSTDSPVSAPTSVKNSDLKQNAGSKITARHTRPPAIPDYEILRRIGGGSYGEVWLARSATGALRALKIVWRDTFEDDRPFQREFEGIQCFERLSREHPSQLALFHVGRGEGYFFYVMELADDVGVQRSDGVLEFWSDAKNAAVNNSTTPPLHNFDLYSPHTLRADLEHGRLPAARVLELGLTLTEALGHLHENGLIHRDIKPSNIIFVGGRPKLVDIGLVTDAGDARSIVGTEGYLATEGPGMPQADIFALGKVLYEAATGLDRRQFPQLPPDLRTWPDAALVFELNEILVRACAVSAHDRYTNTEAMYADLDRLAGGKSVKRERTRERCWALGKRLAFTAGALLLLFAVIQQVVVWRETNTAQSTMRHKPKNEEAIRLYQQARHYFNQLNDDGFGKALELLDRATELEPQFVDAYALRFQIYTWTFKWSRLEIAAKTRAVADKLMAIDSSLGEAHAALAWSELCEFKWEESEKEFKTAIRLDPNYALARSHYALLLAKQMRLDEARPEFKRALELDPTSRMMTLIAGFPDFAAHHYDKTIAQYQKALDLDPGFGFARRWIGEVYEVQTNYTAAIATFEKADILAGNDPAKVAQKYDALRRVYEEQGERGYWHWKLDTLTEDNSPRYLTSKARIYAGLGEKEKALDWLENAFDRSAWDTTWLKVWPWWDSLREEPRFKVLLRSAGLEK